MYDLERDSEEIDELANRCADAENDGTSKYPGMTYEQGILAAIRWLTENTADHPLDE